MEWSTDISSLSNKGLFQYKDYLLDQILCKEGKESLRSKVLDRVDLIHLEMTGRGLKERADYDETCEENKNKT